MPITKKLGLALAILLTALLTGPASAMVFKSQIVRAIWDNWCCFHKGTYYLYYLISERSGWEGFGVATSTDGVHWQDHGWAIRASNQMVDYLGTGAVWKSPDFDRSGRFLCNYSEWRKEPGTDRKTQNILFAWSTDLIHWTKFGDESMFKVDGRYYDKYGRWDCIYPMPRAEGGDWGTWTATARPGQSGGIVGLGYSKDGLHWTALPPPQVTPGVAESGAFWKFGNRIYAMFGAGSMWSYGADQVTRPYRRAEKNAQLLPAGHTYFSRFFPLPDGTVLVNHQSNSDWGWHVATLKQAVVDAEGTLRLKYWSGNEALKGKPLAASPQGASNAVVMMTGPLDIQSGFVAEGTVRLPSSDDSSPVGFYLLPDNRGGHAVRLWADGRAEFGTIDPFGGSWKLRLATSRDWKFADSAAFRLLVRRGMLELYLDDYLVDCYHLRGAGGCESIRLGVLGDAGRVPVSNLKVWQMSLPGKPKATASSVYSEDHTADKAFDGDPNTRWSSGRPYGNPEWLQIDFETPKAIRKVVIRWEAFAKRYELLISEDGRQWTSIHSTDQGRGGEKEIEGLGARGRYLRLNCLERGTQHGFSVWELRVE